MNLWLLFSILDHKKMPNPIVFKTQTLLDSLITTTPKTGPTPAIPC